MYSMFQHISTHAHIKTHTHISGVCLRGDEQQYFSTASVSALFILASPGLPGLAVTRDLLAHFFVAELSLCLFECMCVCVCTFEIHVKQLPLPLTYHSA